MEEDMQLRSVIQEIARELVYRGRRSKQALFPVPRQRSAGRDEKGGVL